LTCRKLEAFEKQYHMSTAEFVRRFTSDDLGETLDFLEWQGETKMLALLEEKRRFLKTHRSNENTRWDCRLLSVYRRNPCAFAGE